MPFLSPLFFSAEELLWSTSILFLSIFFSLQCNFQNFINILFHCGTIFFCVAMVVSRGLSATLNWKPFRGLPQSLNVDFFEFAVKWNYSLGTCEHALLTMAGMRISQKFIEFVIVNILNRLFYFFSFESFAIRAICYVNDKFSVIRNM